MVNRKLHPKKFFTEEEKERIVQAIHEAERQTSGEIRVYLESQAKGHLMERAKKIFEKLGMTKTRHQNGVLIYFSLLGHSFAVLGDRGIHEKVGDNFWKEIVSVMEESFSREEFASGIIQAIRKAGEKLKKYFPHEKGDLNELPDEIGG